MDKNLVSQFLRGTDFVEMPGPLDRDATAGSITLSC
jgi:hypothetical protein